MEDPDRGEVIYVTSDSSEWLRINVPFGLISPPMIELHKPQVGTVVFYHADMYQLKAPREAKSSLPR